MTVPVVWLSLRQETPARLYWDQSSIEALFSHELWRPVGAHEFEHLTTLDGLDGAIVVIPGAYQGELVGEINAELAKLKWCLVIVTSDEENNFPIDKLKHPSMKIWATYMNPKYKNMNRWLPIGPARFVHQPVPEKDLDWFYAGQVNHDSRQKCVEVLKGLPGGKLVETAGFAQGLPPWEYHKYLAQAKIVPAPKGNISPDSFRLYEALEAGAIPIPENPEFWRELFGEEPPFPVLTDYNQLAGYTRDALDNWKPLANRTFAWWMRKKREMAYNLHFDIAELQHTGTTSLTPNDLVTVLISSSPIPSHPDTAMIEQTIRDVRTHLPDCEIIIMLDGVRSEQEDRREDYEEYKRRLLWLAHHEWSNVLPVIYDEHLHQASMTRRALELVMTPIILFVEHDAPLTPDCEIDWVGVTEAVLQGHAYVIRFHFESQVLAEHEYLMLGQVETVAGVPMRKTMQWSQRPQLASTAFYRQMLENYFHPDSRTMIEDVIHGAVIEDCRRDSIMGWYSWRLWIYTPEGSIKRSYHLDGRGDDPKYSMEVLPVEGRG